MSDFLTSAKWIAKQAGEILLSHFQSDELEIRIKADGSLVTQADIDADEFIANELTRRFPGEPILSEEHSPGLHISPLNIQQLVWVIDPLDGTTNFSLKLQHWGVSIARLENGLPTLAILCYPLIGELYWAQIGSGAYMNGQPLRTQPDRFKGSSFFTCCSRTFQRYDIDIRYKTRILGCASYSFCTIARGSAILGMEATPKIWDIAAAWLIVQESGGEIGPLAGSNPFPLQSGLDYTSQEFPTIAASSLERLSWGKQHIQPKAARARIEQP